MHPASGNVDGESSQAYASQGIGSSATFRLSIAFSLSPLLFRETKDLAGFVRKYQTLLQGLCFQQAPRFLVRPMSSATQRAMRRVGILTPQTFA